MYTQCSATKSVSSDWFNGKKYYTKKNLSASSVQNYVLAQKLGFGVKLTKINGDTIQMQGGHNVHKIVDQKIVGPAGMKMIWKEIQRIRGLLIANGLAHCDIKALNIAVKFLNQDLTSFRVFLIDLDDMKKFGEVRRAGTPGWNFVQGTNWQVKTDQNTDRMGFENVRKFMGV